MWNKVKDYLKKYVSIRYGLAGALFLGVMVFSINYYKSDHLMLSLTAALKQAAYTFLFGGYVSALCERYTEKKKYILAVLLPSCIAIGATFLVHSLKGTPNPVLSTIPTMVFAPLGFYFIGFRKRKELQKEIT
ncbi:hypothetical protein KMW28_14985 [Flammeovirga yaeyamensis]|uniref:Uncharacterized protein n=1 Tax=Flammeovirga yaeyamensis TaxID=367791 RepID=A0AAX1N3I9_9BACT|nr:hypothetical protein [Flammeovirga yaeyamensis]MBB3700100.1 ABC-type Mn2+/Zn2+ transport system permease subunit [Flammeovirga yaeyamensis]NMF37269.1 hypothetical protein [Flammeovirga yaeyamensis]QWG00956.1 hypothetical protein KMW28_14985 [Flammeovirga yaeyamensis]